MIGAFLQAADQIPVDLPQWVDVVGLAGVASVLLWIFARFMLAVPNMYIATMRDLRDEAQVAIKSQRASTAEFIEFLQTTQALTTEALVRAANQMGELTQEVRNHNADGSKAIIDLRQAIDLHNRRHAAETRRKGTP